MYAGVRAFVCCKKSSSNMCNVFGTQSLFGRIKSAFLVSNVTAFIFNVCVAGEKDAVCTYSFCAGNCKVIVQQWATYENSNCK